MCEALESDATERSDNQRKYGHITCFPSLPSVLLTAFTSPAEVNVSE